MINTTYSSNNGATTGYTPVVVSRCEPIGCCPLCFGKRGSYSKGTCHRCYMERPGKKENKREEQRRRLSSPVGKEQRKIWEKAYRKTPNGKDAIYRKYKKHNLKKKYGLTVEQRDKLFSENNGLCWICKEQTAWAIDHDHMTGKIRGALCTQCNTSLGGFRDNPDILKSAISYLENNT